jgi:hypothetical protein
MHAKRKKKKRGSNFFILRRAPIWEQPVGPAVHDLSGPAYQVKKINIWASVL